jgi:hypothetical protein
MFFKFAEYFIPLIVLFGIITSFDDINFGKIENKHIFLAMIMGASIHLFLIITERIGLHYLLFYSAIICLTILVAFLLYLLNFWSAGDGKLLIAYIFIMPLTIAPENTLNLVIPVYLLINTFIPYFLISAGYVFLINLTAHSKKIDGKPNMMFAIESILYVFSITWVVSILLKYTNLPSNAVTIMVASGLVMAFLEKLTWSKPPAALKTTTDQIQKTKTPRFAIPKTLIIMAIISIIRIIVDIDRLKSWEFIIEFLVFYVLLMLLRSYIRASTTSFFTKKVHVLKLSKGMVLNSHIIKKTDKYSLIESPNLKDLKNILESEFQENLKDEDIKRLVELYKKNMLEFKEVLIQNTLPFAPLMFAGVILTILAKGTTFFLFGI